MQPEAHGLLAIQHDVPVRIQYYNDWDNLYEQVASHNSTMGPVRSSLLRIMLSISHSPSGMCLQSTSKGSMVNHSFTVSQGAA
jgi:negative regulator of replication initiation